MSPPASRSPRDRLFGPRLKIDRAKEHIRKFKHEVSAFDALHPYRLVLEENPKGSTRRSWVVRIKHELPPRLTCIAGDAVHNLRSALDFLIFEIVAPRKASDIRRVQFPFCERAEDLKAVIKKRLIEGAGKQVVDTIVSLQPYPRGDGRVIALLNDLDISDKHKSIIEVGSIAIAKELIISDDLARYRIPNARLVAADGYIVTNPSSSLGHLQLGNEVNLTAQILLRTKGRHLPAAPLLDTFVSKVEKTIDRLAVAAGITL